MVALLGRVELNQHPVVHMRFRQIVETPFAHSRPLQGFSGQDEWDLGTKMVADKIVSGSLGQARDFQHLGRLASFFEADLWACRTIEGTDLYALGDLQFLSLVANRPRTIVFMFSRSIW